MKTRMAIKTAFFTIAILSTPIATQAQQPQDASNVPHLEGSDLKQYPSFIEVSGTAVGGAPNTQFVLRCGYVQNGNQMVPDPTVNDLSLLNTASPAYARYQFIDGNPVISMLDPASAPSASSRQVILQVTESDNTVKAKSCKTSLNNDTIQGCTIAKPFMTADQSKTAVTEVQKQCVGFLGQASSQVQPNVYSAQKTNEWKAKLHQTLMQLQQ